MAATKKEIDINQIPAIVWGNPSRNLYLYIHGQDGNKEEAECFANIADKYGLQVLSIDLPEHGDRMNETNSFDPWHIVPELHSVMEYARCRWEKISLYANSIGAWFSMLSFYNERLEQCLFVSPVPDMKYLIDKLMTWANVSEARLMQERMIPTAFGQTLSWEYWEYALAHPIRTWEVCTKILYGEKDHLIDCNIVEQFADEFHCELSVIEGGEHWFHTEEQMAVWCRWIANCLGHTN